MASLFDSNTSSSKRDNAIVEEYERPTFSLIAASVSFAANKSMFSVVNETTTKILRLEQLFIRNVQTAAVTGVIGEFRMNRISSHSGGASINKQTYDTADTADAQFTARFGASFSGESASDYFNRWFMSNDEWGVGSADVESNDQTQMKMFPVYEKLYGQKPIVLRSGEGIHIKQITSTTVGSVDIVGVFTWEDL